MHGTSLRPGHRLARPLITTAIALTATLTLGSCGTPATDSAPVPATRPAAGSSPSSADRSTAASTAAPVVLESGWAKAGAGMTAVFGTVVNRSSEPVTIVGGSSPSAGMVQVHTMARQPNGSMKMTEKKGGLAIPAGGSAVLAPGADHLMLIGLRAPLANGGEVTVVLATASGAALEWTVPVRSFAGAQETYVPEGH